jgi:hypothetical protein
MIAIQAAAPINTRNSKIMVFSSVNGESGKLCSLAVSQVKPPLTVPIQSAVDLTAKVSVLMSYVKNIKLRERSFEFFMSISYLKQ